MLYYICIIYGGVQYMEVPQIIQVIRIRPWLSIETTMATWGFTNFRTSFRPSWVTDGVTHGAYQCGIHLQSVKQCEGSVVNERRQDAAHGFLVAAQVVKLCRLLGKVTCSRLWTKLLPNSKFCKPLGKVSSISAKKFLRHGWWSRLTGQFLDCATGLVNMFQSRNQSRHALVRGNITTPSCIREVMNYN
jgi:hypothetical protein